MKKNKFITLVSSIIALATVSFTAIAVQAADDSVVLELNGATTDTSKVVDVYYEGETATQFDTIEMEITVDGAELSEVGMETVFGNSLADFLSNGNIAVTLVNASPVKVENNKLLLCTLTLPVEVGTGDFTLEVVYFDDCDSLLSDDGSINVGSITIPGEEPVEDEPVEVATEGKLYADYADAAVYACVADAVTVADVTGKTLTWNIKAADKVVGTTPVNVGTVLSGEESTVVFGLMIVNDNDTAGFDTIDSAVLVIE